MEKWLKDLGLVNPDGAGVKDYMHALDTDMSGMISRSEFTVFMKYVREEAIVSPSRPEATQSEIFLGGSCNPTTWRKDTVIPLLEKTGVSYYNPQVDAWHEGLILTLTLRITLTLTLIGWHEGLIAMEAKVVSLFPYYVGSLSRSLEDCIRSVLYADIIHNPYHKPNLISLQGQGGGFSAPLRD